MDVPGVSSIVDPLDPDMCIWVIFELCFKSCTVIFKKSALKKVFTFKNPYI